MERDFGFVSFARQTRAKDKKHSITSDEITIIIGIIVIVAIPILGQIFNG